MRKAIQEIRSQPDLVTISKGQPLHWPSLMRLAQRAPYRFQRRSLGVYDEGISVAGLQIIMRHRKESAFFFRMSAALALRRAVRSVTCCGVSAGSVAGALSLSFGVCLAFAFKIMLLSGIQVRKCHASMFCRIARISVGSTFPRAHLVGRAA